MTDDMFTVPGELPSLSAINGVQLVHAVPDDFARIPTRTAIYVIEIPDDG